MSNQRCTVLATEYGAKRPTNTAVSALDSPESDNVSLAYELAPKALLASIRSGANEEAKNAAQTALQTVSTAAAVTQTGGSAGSSGSTNLASKPTTTDLISIASESGAFTDTVNGTTATIQANALGLLKYMGNRPIFERWESRYADAIQPLNFAVTLNIAQSSSSSTVATTGAANSATPSSIASILLPTNNASFSSFKTSYNVYRPYSPQDKTFLANWSKAVTANQSTFATDNAAIATAIQSLLPSAFLLSLPTQLSGPLTTWHAAAADAFGKGDFDAYVGAFKRYDDAFCDLLMQQPGAASNALALLRAIESFDSAVDAVVNQARGTPLVTLSYTYSTPAQKPATHGWTASGSYLFKGNPVGSKPSFTSGVQLTGNFTGEIFASVPTGATYGRLKDVQTAMEVDKPFGGTVASPRGTLSLAGYGQYQYDPSVINITATDLIPGTNISLPGNAQVLVGTAGWLGVVQGKVVINLKNGLTLPVAVKWSNKTDLLQGSDTRGQIGLSYDLSALPSLITGQK
jgi:hypothetical protein